MKRLIIIFLLLLAMASLASVLMANAANGYGLSWLTVDGGGGTSQGGQYRALDHHRSGGHGRDGWRRLHTDRWILGLRPN